MVHALSQTKIDSCCSYGQTLLRCCIQPFCGNFHCAHSCQSIYTASKGLMGTGKQARCCTTVRHMHVCSLLNLNFSCWLHSHIRAWAPMCCDTCFHQVVSHSLPWIYFGQFPKAWYTSRRSSPPLLLATIPLIRFLRLFSNITPTVATELPVVY